ncbi:DOT1-domain-containing protein [Massarina eburnea CBS 473.64]|uniref:Histone-lysine N-methyltransferase, H3 lysine-79 specific n=1 Tax=Massarina eburnea CBS 473.64 TaxID=1395130 RepID=A0A6A6SGI6_9PLEO|nr:DOT1-domain-containing protein [Massarina eburnea CBS 473.64]
MDAFNVKPAKIKTKLVTKLTPAPVASRPAKPPPTNRFNLTPAPAKARASPSVRYPEKGSRNTLSVSSVQRKRKVTPSTPQWADSDSDEASDDELAERKRQKTSSSIEPTSLNRCLEPDSKRRIRMYDKDGSMVDQSAGKGAAVQRGVEPARLVPGLELTQGEWAKDYKPAFPDASSESGFVVELQYPSPARPERFETIIYHSKTDNTNYNPLDDIYFSIEEIIQHYLPQSLIEAHKLSDEADGIVRLLKRAVTKNSPSDFRTTLTQFNAMIKDNMDDVSRAIDDMRAVPLSLVKRITAQVYQRTVSYRAHLLRQVKGKSTTYGELLPNFVHTIFQQTGLNSQSVFVDLGSGVGNVVLQSALQTGAESWGIEIMNKPAEYALDQASELRARARLWNISLGPITLLHGDFTNAPAIDAALRRADVVLVNNKVFPQTLNEKLLDKFLDLKDGAKVVSLESFASGAGVWNKNAIANSIFTEQRFDSGTGSVSWADVSVEYFIATKRGFGT